MPSSSTTGLNAINISSSINLHDLPDLEILRGRESELNWEPRDRLISNLIAFFGEQRSLLDYSHTGMAAFSGSFADLRASFQALPANDPRFVISGWIKSYYDDIMAILHTPRTQLSIRTCNFISAFAVFLGPGLFDSFAENSLSNLIKLAGTTKKIIATSAADSAKLLCTSIVPQRAFPVLLNGAIDKNVNSRLRSFECLKIISERTYEGAVHQKIWEGAVEKVLQKGIGDANAEIRSVALNIFLFFKEKVPDSVNKFMDRLDPSTKKQLSLLLAKSSGTPKASKPIVSSVPLAQIRKAALKDHSDAVKSDGESSGRASLPKTPEKLEKTERAASPLPKSPIKSPLKASKSNYELGRLSPRQQQQQQQQLQSSLLPSSPLKSSKSPLKAAKSATNLQASRIDSPSTDIPMDQISIRPVSPVKSVIKRFNELSSSSVMKSGAQYNESNDDIFMDAYSGDNLAMIESSNATENIVQNTKNNTDSIENDNNQEEEDEEVILNVKNVVKTVDDLTNELPRKIELGATIPSTPLTKAKRPFEWSPAPSPSKTSSLPHSISSPSLPSRIKSLGLAAGTPLRAMYRNSSAIDMKSLTLPSNVLISQTTSTLLNDLIEEFCNTKDFECFKKILALTSKRSGDFDGLTADLIHKLFINSSDLKFNEDNFDNSKVQTQNQINHQRFRLLKNFLFNESFLLSLCGREIVEILEVLHVSPSESDRIEASDLMESICQSNLIPIITESCVELCCVRLSEFKLILLSTCIKYFIGTDFKEILLKSITPLILALNHPDLNIRRLSMSCFLEARKRFDGRTESLLAILDETKVSPLQRRIIEGFLHQF